jgi:acyl carrier protein
MMNVQLLEEVIGIIAEHLGLTSDDVAIDSDITGDLGADSLDIVELVDKFETKYNITVTDEEIMQLLSVEDIVNALAVRLGEGLKSDSEIGNAIQLSF